MDPWRHHGVTVEDEREPGGRSRRAITVFLAGAECPWTCVFCDLWRFATPEPTPPGALPSQLRSAFAEVAPPPDARIKLYNAGNFFDDRAVPPEDDEALASLVAPFARVTVECHPRLVGKRCLEFARRLSGRLEVAVGLETVHPEALPRLAKGATLEDFQRAAGRLRQADVGLRCFVLVGAPFVPRHEDSEWVVRSARHAFDLGAEHVSLIPVRKGNGFLDRLEDEGQWTPSSLEDLEDAFDRSLTLENGSGVVSVDLWDLEKTSSCPRCFPARRRRLERINLTGQRLPRVACQACRSFR